MREIKVRGYCVEEMIGSQWVEGFGVMFSEFSEEHAKVMGRDGDYILFTQNGRYEVEGKSVGQYTGLNDCNGREIYEGDVLQLKVKKGYEYLGNVGVIRMSYSAYMVETVAGEHLFIYFDEVEVIGNIYENPELLEESK